MRKFFSKLFFFVFCLLVIALFAGLLSTIINPKFFWPLAFFGLAFPLIFFAIAAYCIYWLFTKNGKAFFAFSCLLVSLLLVPRFFNFLPKKNKAADQELKVMSYNVRNFEAYDKDNGKEKRDSIVALIKEKNVDILCLQEAYEFKKHINLTSMSREVDLPNFHFEVGTTAKSGGKFGVAVFSKYPIVNQESYQFGSGGNVGTKVDLKVDQDTISVFNIHLESANIENSYYNYSSDSKEDLSETPLLGRAKIVSKQLKEAFQNRSNQSKLIAKEISESGKPTILCGDFNDTPISYSYSKVKGNMQDSFRKGDFGFGATYPDLPFLRIDHILISKEFNILKHKIINEKISDHYPVIVTAELKGKQKKADDDAEIEDSSDE